MQSQDLKVGAGNSTLVQVPGTGIWFESGASTTADAYIVVKPDTGAEITLKPGQHFQDPTHISREWRITGHDPAAVITGRLIIGNGDFGDSNISNTVSINNVIGNVPVVGTVTVGNTGANRVPIAINPTDTIKTQVMPMTYTTGINTAAAVNVAVNIVTAAANVNGAILQQTLVSGQTNGTTYGTICFIAKATAPASITDGDLLDCCTYGPNSFTNFQNQSPIQVAAGKGIWLISNFNEAVMQKGALVTVL